MTKPKHTPGPWGIEKTAIDFWIGPMRADGHKVDDVVVVLHHEGLKWISYEKTEANARLIAAAPDMYHLLLMIAERCEELTNDVATDGFDPNELLDAMIGTGQKARAVIAKAEGKSE